MFAAFLLLVIGGLAVACWKTMPAIKLKLRPPPVDVKIHKIRWSSTFATYYVSWPDMAVDMIVPIIRNEGLDNKGYWKDDINSYPEDAVWWYSDYYTIPKGVFVFCEKHFLSEYKEREAKHLLKVNEDLRKSNEALKEKLGIQ